LLLTVWVGSSVALQAENLLQNPDFTDGKKKWKTEGSVKHTELKEDGELIPAMEMSLSSRRPTELLQKFDLEPTKKLYVEVIAKASEDFEPLVPDNINADNDMVSVGGYYRSNPPKRSPNDILIEINDSKYWHYTAGKLKPGGDWTKITKVFNKLSLKDARGKDFDERTFNLIAPMGNGKIWVRSVKAELR